MKIKEITDTMDKQAITRYILESLPDWFGILEAREEYIAKSKNQIFFCAFDSSTPVGFLYLKETGSATVELYCMGVLKDYHRRGIGREMFNQAKKFAREHSYSFFQVKTVQMGIYEQYDRTNKFYLSLGFKELEVFPMLWDKNNPCQIYIMSLE